MTITRPDSRCNLPPKHPRWRFGLVYLLHRDERGTISILSVFAVLMLAMVLGMVMNTGRQVNNKVQMQNAADAAAYAGSVVMSRGMNTLAFTNHLLCDVFALTAFMREARARHSEPLVPEILAAWKQAGEKLSTAEFEKFKKLGPAIIEKVTAEQEMFASYLAWGTAASDAILPMLEDILRRELIREYQNTVRLYTADLAQNAANETAFRHGGLQVGALYGGGIRAPMQAQFVASYRDAWEFQPSVNPNGSGRDVGVWRPMLPCLDPLERDNASQIYLWENAAREKARQQRHTLAVTYLRMWNSEAMAAFRTLAKMGQFAVLWNGFTCGQLEELLEDNKEKNLPFLIPEEVFPLPEFDGDEMILPFLILNEGRLWSHHKIASTERNQFLENGYIFICVVYWEPPAAFGPKWFSSPVQGDNVAYAQAMMFIPQNRLIRVFQGQQGPAGPEPTPIGGVPGEFVNLPQAGDPQAPVPPPVAGGGDPGRWTVIRESRPDQWNLLSQNWRAQLMPATHPSLAAALRMLPQSIDGMQPAREVVLPDFSDLTQEDLSVLNHH